MMDNQFFTQKSGSRDRLEGRVTAYSLMTTSEGAPEEVKGFMQGGSNIFAVQADCRQEQTVDDFFRSELGSSLKKGLDQVIQKLRDSGIWNDQMDSTDMMMKDEEGFGRGMAELIPVMARIVGFNNEEDALSQDGDVFFLGYFSDFQAASMCAQSFALLYQFRYREQEKLAAKNAVEELLAQIGQNIPEDEIVLDCGEDLEKKLYSSYIPAILYTVHDEPEHQKAVERFRGFMKGYKFPEDVEEIIEIAGRVKADEQKTHVKKLELLIQKIVALVHEDFEGLADIQRDLQELS